MRLRPSCAPETGCSRSGRQRNSEMGPLCQGVLHPNPRFAVEGKGQVLAATCQIRTSGKVIGNHGQ